MTLKQLLFEQCKIKFPEFSEEDEFSEWVEELIETDAYYVGLIQSMSEGEKVHLNSVALNQLKAKLEVFSNLNEREIFKECKTYLNSLEHLVSIALNQNNLI